MSRSSGSARSLQLAAEVTAERVLMMKDPGALEDLMANQLVDVLRDVFGSKWSRMCQNLRKLTSEAPCLRVDLPAVSGSSGSGTTALSGPKDSAPSPGVEAMDTRTTVASPTQPPGAMVEDSAPNPRKWTFSFGGAYCRASSDAYQATQPGSLCVFAASINQMIRNAAGRR